MAEFKPMVTKLTGRVLKREIASLSLAWRDLEQPVLARYRDDIRQRGYEIFRNWAAENYPAADLDVCERYRCVVHVEGINIRCYDGGHRWDETYGIEFPPGKTVRIPAGWRWASKYAAVYYREEPDPRHDEWAGYVGCLGPLVEYVRNTARDVEAAQTAFYDYIAERPLRREFAARYPEIARRVWPMADNIPEPEQKKELEHA